MAAHGRLELGKEALRKVFTSFGRIWTRLGRPKEGISMYDKCPSHARKGFPAWHPEHDGLLVATRMATPRHVAFLTRKGQIATGRVSPYIGENDREAVAFRDFSAHGHSKCLISLHEHQIDSRNHWQLVVICSKGDNDMPFLMLLDSLHMGEPTRIKNELKNFLKIAYEGKEMRAVADELKVIDLHVPKVPQQKGSTECGFMVLYFIFCFILTAPASFGTNDYPSFLTADWFSREEYEKFREDLQGKRIHIDARSASTSKVVKRGPTMLRSIHGLQSNERIPVKINQMGQPVGEGGQLPKQFLGTVARMGDKLPIDFISWRLIPSSNKDDVWDFIQRKFDVPISLSDFAMKDLDQKWRSWKYDLRTKFFTPYQKAQQQLWSSEEFKLDSLKDSSSTSSFPAIEVDQKTEGIEDLGADEIAKEIRDVKR
ncbi:hypothetical protein Taro_040324 [Colocasia esculenta]|uniref:Ubiquitin-like protease family profile domain-containing protein n=1 Tax=Colocasia esculenta TaxID=4460 RepID=A0A843W8P3_COLES|nr:hypothetical protein [Colocasia esculenta]